MLATCRRGGFCKRPLITVCSFLFCIPLADGATIFVEAEKFQGGRGWSIVDGTEARRASGLAMLSGTQGSASTVVSVKDAGSYRVWVRYESHPTRRAPFHVAALAKDRLLGEGEFDVTPQGKSVRNPEVWQSFDVVLPDGEVALRLTRPKGKQGKAMVDCVLLTMDQNLVPNHLHFGAQTFLRVTLGDGYQKPAYLHVFADHYHAPWYQHYSIAHGGTNAGLAPAKDEMLKAGERTDWCNITPMLYQDSGAILKFTVRYSYYDTAPQLRAKFEFATAADEQTIIRTLNVDNQPGKLVVCLPPNLLTPENLAHFRTDRDIAEATGKLADAHAWPAHGRRAETFPFMVSAHIADSYDAVVTAREQKTLDYFGFTSDHLRHVGGVWHTLEGSYCRPDLVKMKSHAVRSAAEFRSAGGDVQKIMFAELTDEPTGQSLEFISQDAAYAESFRAWLKKLGRTPDDLLVANWDAVKPVTEGERDRFPALYYFSQRFRTRALGDLMAVQRSILEQAYGTPLRTLANFSDGAVYQANFYGQGVDYFELLDSPDQNAIWGEDWSNGASTYQCASYNVDLMRAAARERKQVIGHHLIAYAGRKPWDIKLKATSEAARGVKMFNSFCYGPSWATHEGGPFWRSSVWYAKPETWTANAALTREIGAAEDLLLEAMPARAKVALLYSSASDAWAIGGNQAYGFDRMHTWLALTHAQVPVDIVHESQVARGELEHYAVCYLSGKNLSRSAVEPLKRWVAKGGRLWMTAGAATNDEYNRPLATLNDLIPAARDACVDMQPHQASGKYLRGLAAKDHVHGSMGESAVLSVKQASTPRVDAEVLARFDDQAPAIVRGKFGEGSVYSVGFLPALAYVKTALDARHALEERRQANVGALSSVEAEMLDRSDNPWEFPAHVRELLLMPTKGLESVRQIECSEPLVDTTYMPHEKGVLIPIANYTNRPGITVNLHVHSPRDVARAESAVRGAVQFKTAPDGVWIRLPLDNNDFLKLYFK